MHRWKERAGKSSFSSIKVSASEWCRPEILSEDMTKLHLLWLKSRIVPKASPERHLYLLRFVLLVLRGHVRASNHLDSVHMKAIFVAITNVQPAGEIDLRNVGEFKHVFSEQNLQTGTQ